MNKTLRSPGRDLALTIVLLVATLSASAMFAADLAPVLESDFSSGDWRASLETGGFMTIVLLLICGVLVYQLSRLGYCLRVLRFREEDLDSLARLAFGGPAPGLTFLIPSYKEDPRIVEQALLSVALQDYPAKRVVLLIDDPPFPGDPSDQEKLEETRRLCDRIRELVSEPRERAHNAYLSFVGRGKEGTLRETELLCQAYQNTTGWLLSLRGQFPAADHTNRLFAKLVLAEPAERLQREAARLAGREIPACEVEMRYRRLIALLTVDISSFERKLYASLCHEPNKAMNINSYLSLLGSRFTKEEKDGKIFLVRSEDGIEFPETEYVAVLDADSMLAGDYALRLIAFMERPDNRRIAVIQTPYSAVPQAPASSSAPRARRPTCNS